MLRLVAKGAFDKKSPAWLALPREARDREFSGKITEIGKVFGLRVLEMMETNLASTFRRQSCKHPGANMYL